MLSKNIVDEINNLIKINIEYANIKDNLSDKNFKKSVKKLNKKIKKLHKKNIYLENKICTLFVKLFKINSQSFHGKKIFIPNYNTVSTIVDRLSIENVKFFHFDLNNENLKKKIQIKIINLLKKELIIFLNDASKNKYYDFIDEERTFT